MQRTILTILLVATMAAIASLLLGSDFLFQTLALKKNGVITQDMNGDGKTDYRETWSDGQLLSLEQDGDNDGRYDSFSRFRRDEIWQMETDLDHDGEYDYRETWEENGDHLIEIKQNGHYQARAENKTAGPE